LKGGGMTTRSQTVGVYRPLYGRQSHPLKTASVGFTLVELMIVIAIIGILISLHGACGAGVSPRPLAAQRA